MYDLNEIQQTLEAYRLLNSTMTKSHVIGFYLWEASRLDIGKAWLILIISNRMGSKLKRWNLNLDAALTAGSLPSIGYLDSHFPLTKLCRVSSKLRANPLPNVSRHAPLLVLEMLMHCSSLCDYELGRESIVEYKQWVSHWNLQLLTNGWV